jgi:hypothetical protein
MMIDPTNVEIHGDISRADVLVLVEVCTNKDVVEFGVGGSTLILSRCAKSLQSYDTDHIWLDRARNRLSKIHGKTCEPTLHHCNNVPDTIPICDVLFIDGYGPHRLQWLLKHFDKCKIVICHDSLGDTSDGPALYHIMAEMFRSHDMIQMLYAAKFHYLDSNMVVLEKRDAPITYRNWNITEKDDNRKDPYID